MAVAGVYFILSAKIIVAAIPFGQVRYGILARTTALFVRSDAGRYRARRRGVGVQSVDSVVSVRHPASRGVEPRKATESRGMKLVALVRCAFWMARRSPASVRALLAAGAVVTGTLFPTGYAAVDELLAAHHR